MPTTLWPLTRYVFRSGVFICALFVSFGCNPTSNGVTEADLSAADVAPTTTADPAQEQLWLTPPEGWTLAANLSSKLADGVRHVRYLDPQEPSHSLTIETRNNSTLGKPAADPLDLLEQLAENEQQDCKAAEDFNTFTGVEHGYGTAVRLFICEPTGLTSGRLTLLKIIQGQQQTYLVALQHQWSNAPGTTAQDSLGLQDNSNNIFDRVAAWSLYMRKVRVCAASGCQQQDN